MVTDRVGPTITTLKAEVDYLDGEVKKLLKLLADERTECMRLRAALEGVLSWHDYANDMHKPIEVRAAYIRARAALNGEEGK